jgi:predicted ferric reductase
MERKMTQLQSTEPNPESAMSGRSAVVVLLAAALGITAAVLVLPNWLPDLAGSMVGSTPKVFWYLSRSTALVSMGILWASMMLGVGITNKMARMWPGAPAAFALHEYLSLLGLGFAAFHGLILLGDHYANFSLSQILIPFTTSNFHPLGVGLGQLGLYTWAIVTASFYVRKYISQGTWRTLHYVAFFTYMAALVHGITSGTDTSLPWVQGFYWITGASLLFLTTARVVNSLTLKSEKKLAGSARR